eukprot:778470-Prorocentrum_minimum.AAC.2
MWNQHESVRRTADPQGQNPNCLCEAVMLVDSDSLMLGWMMPFISRYKLSYLKTAAQHAKYRVRLSFT